MPQPVLKLIDAALIAALFIGALIAMTTAFSFDGSAGSLLRALEAIWLYFAITYGLCVLALWLMFLSGLFTRD